MNINELKAKAYDCMAQIEYWNMELQKTNEAILEYVNEVPESVKVDEEK